MESRRLGISPVSLCKNDVPGSSLDERNLSQLENDKLRFWLKCPELKKTTIR